MSETASDETAEKSIEEVYYERNLLAVAWVRHTWHDHGWYEDPQNEGWAIVWAHIPTQGEVSWHVPLTLAQECLSDRWERTGAYDGYDAAEKNRRLRAALGAR